MLFFVLFVSEKGSKVFAVNLELLCSSLSGLVESNVFASREEVYLLLSLIANASFVGGTHSSFSFAKD